MNSEVQSDMPVVSIEHLQRQLGEQCVIKRINANILPGEVVGLLGKNGSGKTTLLETILGFGFPSIGKVKIFGEIATEMSADCKQRIGFVPQQDELMPLMTVLEHLSVYRAMRNEWDKALVERLCLEWEMPLNRMAQKMSIGQRQKLSIILALAHKPDLLILDEPVAALDPAARRQFLQQLVVVAADTGRSIVFSSHIVSDMERIANKIWLLHKGELVWQDSLDCLKESVVRLTVNAENNLPDAIEIEGLLSCEIKGSRAWLIVTQWDEARHGELEVTLSAKIGVEYLGLEDIFLYLTALNKTPQALM